MSGVTTRQGLGYRGVVHKWGWFVALGIVSIVAGLFALVDTVFVTLISVIFIGALLLVSGVFQLIHAFANKGWGSFLFALFAGALYIIGGFLVMDEPVRGAFIITLVLAVALGVGGVLRCVMAVGHQEMEGWWLMLLSGLLSIGLAVLLFVTWPWSGLWVLGTLIGIELLIHGVTWVSFGFALRRLHRTAAG